ncbi:hypothetical protein ABK040_004051 [Willaertia magna]
MSTASVNAPEPNKPTQTTENTVNLLEKVDNKPIEESLNVANTTDTTVGTNSALSYDLVNKENKTEELNQPVEEKKSSEETSGQEDVTTQKNKEIPEHDEQLEPETKKKKEDEEEENLGLDSGEGIIGTQLDEIHPRTARPSEQENKGPEEMPTLHQQISSTSTNNEQQQEGKEYYTIKVAVQKHNFFRVLRIPSDINLTKLHELIMNLLGWSDSHLHVFEDQTGRSFTDKIRNDKATEALDERGVLLRDVMAHERSTLNYTYDLASEWKMIITLQEKGASAEEQEFFCLSGRGGDLDEEEGTKSGKFNKTNVNKQLENFSAQ